MNELQTQTTGEVIPQEMTMENRLAIIEDGIRKKYLARLCEMQIVPAANLLPLEEDLIQNIRLYHVTEMVYEKGEPVTDKFTTVFNTLSTYNAMAFIIMDSDGKKTDFYVGVRNMEEDESLKRSTVTLGDTLKNTLIGHFPGMKIEGRDRIAIAELSNKITRKQNVASVSVVGNSRVVPWLACMRAAVTYASTVPSRKSAPPAPWVCMSIKPGEKKSPSASTILSEGEGTTLSEGRRAENIL